MSGTVVDTVRSKRHKYEIKKVDGGLLSSATFWIYRDGERWKGSYDSLAKAYEVASDAP